MKRVSRAGGPFALERDLLEPTSRFLREESYWLQREETPFYEQRMDLLVYSPSRDLTIAVELKLERWKRAVEQALLYQLCADRVYIAMPETAAGRVDRSRLREHQIGLIEVRRSGCKVLLEAKASRELRVHAKTTSWKWL